MMMEQQMTLKSSDLQERWKSCIQVTCYAYRMMESIKEAIEHLHEVARQIINSLAEVFKPVVETLTLAFKKGFIEEVEDLYGYEKDYPQSYPHYVDTLKVNTKGFPRPITNCARSRC